MTTNDIAAENSCGSRLKRNQLQVENFQELVKIIITIFWA